MKKLFLLAIASTGLFVACTPENNPLVLSDQEAAQSLAYSIAEDQNGVLAQFSDAINYADSSGTCTFAGDSTIRKKSVDGATSKFDYALNYAFARTCNGEMPAKFTLTAAGSGFFDATKMSANDQVGLELSIAGLSDAADFNTINATYSRVGSFKSKILSFLGFENDIQLNLINIRLNKASGKAFAGTGTCKIVSNPTVGKTIYFNASITFIGQRTSFIKINGKTFLFDLVTGEIIQ
jgi:hypothetical protein